MPPPGPGRPLQVVVAGGEDSWAADIAGRMAQALDQQTLSAAGAGCVGWSHRTEDGGRESFAVDVTSLPSAAEYHQRRSQLLAAADAVIFVALASSDGWSIAEHSLAAVRRDLAGRACALLIFGIRPIDGGIGADELGHHLGLGPTDMIATGTGSDPARLREVYALVVRNALAMRAAAAPPAPPADAPPPPSVESAVDGEGAVIEAVLDVARIADDRVIVPAADWLALAELMGELAVIRGTGDDRREALIRALLARGVLVSVPSPGHGAANVWGRSGGVGATGSADGASGDGFLALKEVRRQVLG